eukprot:jgi/Bigna1/86882/estExt_fgenesh1_pg.C_140203
MWINPLISAEPFAARSLLQFPVAAMRNPDRKGRSGKGSSSKESLKRLPFWLSRRAMWVLYSMIATFVIAQIIVNVFVASSKKSSTTAGNKVKDSPDKPVERIRGQEDKRWISLHNEYAQESRNAHSIDVVFFGDSITQHMLNSQAWEEITKMHKVLNFGVGGDRTQHLLWRMDNGELEFKQDYSYYMSAVALLAPPKAVVIMIGTNNLGVDRPAEIAEGAFKAVDRVRQKYPTTIILLVAIPPRSKFAENPIRRDRQLYNEILEQRAAELVAHAFVFSVPLSFMVSDKRPLLKLCSCSCYFLLTTGQQR